MSSRQLNPTEANMLEKKGELLNSFHTGVSLAYKGQGEQQADTSAAEPALPKAVTRCGGERTSNAREVQAAAGLGESGQKCLEDLDSQSLPAYTIAVAPPRWNPVFHVGATHGLTEPGMAGSAVSAGLGSTLRPETDPSS